MKMISRGSRAVRSAARSPARSMIGPAVALIGAFISAAMTWASDVLPTPGGPKSSTWSRASPRLTAASMATRRLATTCGCPTYSSNVRGRSDWSKPRSSSVARAEGGAARPQGGHQLRHLDAGQDVHRQPGADAAHRDEPLEQLLLRAGQEAVEGERVLAHVGVGPQLDVRPGLAQAIEGGHGDRHPVADAGDVHHDLHPRARGHA